MQCGSPLFDVLDSNSLTPYRCRPVFQDTLSDGVLGMPLVWLDRQQSVSEDRDFPGSGTCSGSNDLLIVYDPANSLTLLPKGASCENISC